ncbi:MAG: hypothetical protein ACLQBA_16445 [Candidatus Binataceae bacterium]
MKYLWFIWLLLSGCGTSQSDWNNFFASMNQAGQSYVNTQQQSANNLNNMSNQLQQQRIENDLYNINNNLKYGNEPQTIDGGIAPVR